MIALFLGAAMLAADTSHFVVCATLPATSDTTALTVYGAVSDPFTSLALPPAFTGVVAEVVRSRMKIPRNLPIAAFDPHGWPTVRTTAAFSLMPSGAAKNVAVMASSSSLAIDSLLIAGIDSASRDSSYPPLPPKASQGIRLALGLSTDSAAGATPMFSVRLPTWRDYAPPVGLPNKLHPTVSTPIRGELDTLALTFVVDEQGAPLLGTVHVTRSPGTTFTRTYLDWLHTMRYIPGHIGRCGVHALVSVKGTMKLEEGFIPAP